MMLFTISGPEPFPLLVQGNVCVGAQVGEHALFVPTKARGYGKQ